MCNWNRHPKKLQKIRDKGHVLLTGYKVVRREDSTLCSVIFYHVWVKGWNRAKTRTGGFCRKTIPYRHGQTVNAGIHIFKTRNTAETHCGQAHCGQANMVILPVRYYADEVTSYDDWYDKEATLTVSRVEVTNQGMYAAMR